MTERSSRHIMECSQVITILMVIVMLCGCTKRPKEILSEKELVSLMTDMQLAEAYSNMSDQRYDTDEREQLGDAVLLAHGVSREQLDTTLAWYGRNLDDYSELYEKVDKQIIARRKKLLNDNYIEVTEGDKLWPYGLNGQISKLGTTDSWVFSIPEPDLQKGDAIEWSLHINEPTHLFGILGVEYSNGTSEAFTNNFITRNKIEMKLQTDTARVVKRIYGVLRVKDIANIPVLADSISLRRIPFDSMEYNHYSNIRRYGVPMRKTSKGVEKEDTVSTVSRLDTLNTKEKEKVVMWNSEGTEQPATATRPSQIRPARREMPRRKVGR